jgi:hypothetical protein
MLELRDEFVLAGFCQSSTSSSCTASYSTGTTAAARVIFVSAYVPSEAKLVWPPSERLMGTGSDGDSREGFPIFFSIFFCTVASFTQDAETMRGCWEEIYRPAE